VDEEAERCETLLSRFDTRWDEQGDGERSTYGAFNRIPSAWLDATPMRSWSTASCRTPQALEDWWDEFLDLRLLLASDGYPYREVCLRTIQALLPRNRA
jgi:hypothetical protein